MINKLHINSKNIVLFLLLISVVLFIYVNIWFRTGLTEQRLHAGNYDYALKTVPKKIISGRTSILTIRITDLDKPIIGKLFKADVGHSSGLFIEDRYKDQIPPNSVNTDENGEITFNFTPRFRSFFADNGFGVGAYPVLTSEEQSVRSSQISSGEISVNNFDSANFDFTVYPFWFNWFIF